MKNKFFILFCLYFFQFINSHESLFASRKYIEYNIYNKLVTEKNYNMEFGDFSFTLGATETIYNQGFFELSIFFDMSHFTFYEIKSIASIQNDIEKLAIKIKPKLIQKKESIIEKIKELEISYDLALSQSNQIPIPGSAAFELHDQIQGLYNNLITMSQYEENLDKQIQENEINSKQNLQNNNLQKQKIYGMIDAASSLDSVAQQALASSTSPQAQQVSSFIGSSKFQAAKEVATNTAKLVTDVVFEIENLNEKSKKLEQESKLQQQRAVVYLEEASIIAQIDAVEKLNTKDLDNTSQMEKLQSLYSKLDKIKSIKLDLKRDELTSDKYIRIPIVTGISCYFKLLNFIVPYVNMGLIMSIDNSIYKSLSKINFGVRFTVGVNFEFLNQQFIIGINFKYWAIEKSFLSMGPTISIRI